MSRWLLILLAIALLPFAALPGQAEDQRGNLVPVKPAAVTPETQPTGAPPAAGSLGQPTAADQLYVFWLMGKLISYPFDALDTCIQRLRERPEAVRAIPAAAPGSPNPFDSVKLGQIPPAPPVSSRHEDH